MDAAETAERFVEGRGRGDLDTDEMLRLALTKLVEIVGEAAKQVTEEGRAEMPGVPWSAAARTRDRLVTTASLLDLDVLWVTVTEDLPMLLRILESPDA
ncbi:MAG: HepT-like ribonuclease domain-containing protein [Microthrixaceae bacterium]